MWDVSQQPKDGHGFSVYSIHDNVCCGISEIFLCTAKNISQINNKILNSGHAQSWLDRFHGMLCCIVFLHGFMGFQIRAILNGQNETKDK